MEYICIFNKLHITEQSGRHPSHYMPIALILPRGDCIYVYVCMYINLHITAQSDVYACTYVRMMYVMYSLDLMLCVTDAGASTC